MRAWRRPPSSSSWRSGRGGDSCTAAGHRGRPHTGTVLAVADARRELQRGGYGEALRPGPGCMHAFGLFPQDDFIRKKKETASVYAAGVSQCEDWGDGLDLGHHGFQDFDSVEVEVEVRM